MKVYLVVHEDYESGGVHAGEYIRNANVLAVRLTEKEAWDFIHSVYSNVELDALDATFEVLVEEYDTDDVPERVG